MYLNITKDPDIRRKLLWKKYACVKIMTTMEFQLLIGTFDANLLMDLNDLTNDEVARILSIPQKEFYNNEIECFHDEIKDKTTKLGSDADMRMKIYNFLIGLKSKYYSEN